MRTSQKSSTTAHKGFVASSEKPDKQPRSDGIQAKQNLLTSALRLFAEKGFAKTSTREIALAAGANIAAISYYFGDKEGLYRAAFVEPMGNPHDDIALYDQPHFNLRQSLEGFYTSFLEPMKQGELVQHCMRLHFRELLEPTGLWQQEIEQSITPAHTALIRVLCRNLNLTRTDDELHRLAFAITGLALQVFVGRDVIQAIRPRLIGSPLAINHTVRRLADFAQSMVEGERARRMQVPDSKPAIKMRKTA
jgi:TetR/AcrR family transcriptional regulator, regulator of cefoperazone and chloramphenicol sensitivity